MVLGEVLAALEPDGRQRVEAAVAHSHWYQRAIVEGGNCLEYWQAEK